MSRERAPRARWRRERVGVGLCIDGERAVLVRSNGTWWAAYGDVSATDPRRERVLDAVLRACADAGIVVENTPPADAG